MTDFGNCYVCSKTAVASLKYIDCNKKYTETRCRACAEELLSNTNHRIVEAKWVNGRRRNKLYR